MKNKTVLTVFVSVLLLSSILVTRLTISVNAPRLYDVYPGESIQEAIDLAQLGDMIFVHEGTYSQQLFVNKSLTLIGEDANTTIIEGVGAYKASYVEISGFTIRTGIKGKGINLDDCSGITIRGNIVAGNLQYGLFVVNSRNVVISDNMILDNSDRGVYLRYSSYNTVSNNTVSRHSEYGMFLFHSDNNAISDNTVSNNWYGLRLDSSSNNSFFGNNITDNDLGISSIQSNNNIYHNNFIDNKIQVEELVTSNLWDNGYPSGGNYWSDYTDVDQYDGPFQNETGSDGIWDNPFTINENNQDNYPLVNPAAIPRLPDTTPPNISVISSENKTYTVSNVPLTFVVSETASWIGYSLDAQAIVTIAGNTTLTGLSDGTHSLTVYAKDTAGNTGTSETVYFTVETKEAEPFPITWIVAAIVIIATVGAALLVYFVKVRKTTGKAE
jgi:parallel beta-helix repeat protein